MSDHSHRGEYAEDRHDHSNDYADRHHRHYDLEREDDRLKALIDQWAADLRALREDLSAALTRIRQLEQDTPQARQLQLEADQAAADLMASGFGDDYDPELDDEESPEGEAAPFTLVPRLRRLPCTQCGEPIDHEPTADCPGNPHARPAPEASQP